VLARPLLSHSVLCHLCHLCHLCRARSPAPVPLSPMFGLNFAHLRFLAPVFGVAPELLAPVPLMGRTPTDSQGKTMPDYLNQPPAILRTQKLKSVAAIERSARHTWRLDDVKHVDPERSHLNEDWRPVATPDALLDALEARLETVSAPPARDAVLVIEYLITARRAAFVEHGGETDAAAYFRDALDFLERRHRAENVLAVNIQHDEVAPHLVAYVVPLVERPARTVRRSVFAPGRDEAGRQRRELRTFQVPAEVALSADHYSGGPEKMAALQTAFAEEVGERNGLTRGLEMSAATHTTNRAHHAALAREMAGHVDLTPEELERQGRLWNRESPEEQARRLSEMIREHYAPTVARAATAEHDRRRAREMVETARRHRARYRDERAAHEETHAELSALVEGLAPEQCQTLKRQATQYRNDNRRAEREARERQAAEERAKRQTHEARRAAAQHRQREREENRQIMARAQDNEQAHCLRGITPEAFAALETPKRLRGWRLMRERDELAAEFERVADSGLLEPSGHLSAKGRALVEREGKAPAPADRQAEPSQDSRAAADLFGGWRPGGGPRL